MFGVSPIRRAEKDCSLADCDLENCRDADGGKMGAFGAPQASVDRMEVAHPGAAKQLQLAPAMKTEVQKVLQAMSPAQKLRAAERLYWSARQLKAAALRAQHPDWTEEDVQRAVRQIFLYARN